MNNTDNIFDQALARLRGAALGDSDDKRSVSVASQIDAGWEMVKKGLMELAQQSIVRIVDEHHLPKENVQALGAIQYHARHLVMECERDGPDLEQTLQELRRSLDSFDRLRGIDIPVRANCGPPLPPEPGPAEPPRPPRHRRVD